MIDNVLNNMPPKKEPYLEYFATECDEFHDMGAYEKSTDVNQIAAVYEKYKENPETDRKSTRLNSSHVRTSRMPSSA